MKAKLHGVKRIKITGEYIRLDSLLKYAAIAASGGEAKLMIQNGDVFVNGEPCTIRGKKLRPGDTVGYGGNLFVVSGG